MQKITIVSAGLNEDTGGPSIVVASLAQALTEKEFNVTIVLPDGNVHSSILHLETLGVKLSMFSAKTQYKFSLELISLLSKELRDSGLVWIHGLFQWPVTLAMYVSLFKRKRVVLTPHGVLTRGMLKNKITKKIIGGIPDYLGILLKGPTVHYLSKDEKLKSISLSKNSVVIPNIVPGEKLLNAHNGRICFIGRLVKIKGVLDLMRLENTRIDFYGHDQENYAELIASHELHHYYGVLNHDDVKDTLSLYEAFILPSYAEGLPTSAIEAALSGRILIISENCNLDDLKDGIECIKYYPGYDGLAQGLRRFKAMSRSERENMSRECAAKAEFHYGKEVIINEYLKTLNGSLLK